MIILVFHLEHYCIVYCLIRSTRYLKIGWCLLVRNLAKQKIIIKKIVIFRTWPWLLEWLHTWMKYAWIHLQQIRFLDYGQKILKTSQKKFTLSCWPVGNFRHRYGWALHIGKIRLIFWMLLVCNFFKKTER